MTKDVMVIVDTMDKRRIDEVDSRRDSANRVNSSALAAPRVLSRDEAIGLVRRYKQAIAPRFDVEPRVMMFGSYSKGYANHDSDIDVAVIVPTYGNRKLEISKLLWHDVDQVSFLIEPVLMAEDRWSPLYDDVMRTGVVV